MTVINFPRPFQIPGAWRADEMQRLLGASSSALANGTASTWQVDSTEAGDPQFYLLGPAPDFDCIMCVSRLGRLYVVENGGGKILCETASLVSAVERMNAALRRRTGAIVARVTLAWCSLRSAFEEKIEPILIEPAEALGHVFPQLAALA
jgi:hypothetical protein